ncbi:50S ribosomal protein L18 [endosymbiont of Sipalinus gigas]|uniref:50S ribosomal protein L18 n=1 Tax=endosymbiont of Sipalinus gigas TaxID=1972134 RepID=UPI000DC70A51|nr:50S ribosomal protein L18 [endosymbiont of Sipalinus gigas]BBA85249.1 50S ribosomal protein L18 [endosymbiont of Sipalinus gigas]
MYNKKHLKKLSKSKYKNKNKDIFRLLVNKTNNNIYARIISNDNKIIIDVSTLSKDIKKILIEKNIKSNNKLASKIVGEFISKKAILKNIHNVYFDRSKFKYHGKIKCLAESSREYGLVF